MSPATRDDWDRHWRDYNETAEQNPAQNYRRQLIASLLQISGGGEGARILDIGSGQGDMAASLLAQFPAAAVLGVELSQSGVEIARSKAPGACFVQRDLLDDGDPPRQYQGWATHAVCSEVIEHLDNPAILLKNAKAYMRDDCILALTAPGGPMSQFDRHIGHRKHWRPQEIERLLLQAGYKPQQVTGAGFPFFNLYRSVVILRGKKLIDDVSAGNARRPSTAARAAMAVFQCLIRPTLNSSRTGWQMIARARAS